MMPALIDEPWHVEVWGMVRQPDGTDRTTRAARAALTKSENV